MATCAFPESGYHISFTDFILTIFSARIISVQKLLQTINKLQMMSGVERLERYRLSFAICLSVLMCFGALLRRYYLRDISASSAFEMYP